MSRYIWDDLPSPDDLHVPLGTLEHGVQGHTFQDVTDTNLAFPAIEPDQSKSPTSGEEEEQLKRP